jgi:glycerol-3-phosphate dehydrogenase
VKRNLKQLTDHPYDLLIIGGGIYGAFIAWDAVLRGLSVALVEKGDFGGATSSNSLRVVHGGLRYLQHGDFRRMRESIRERTVLMRIAPHLVHPLPFLMPTYEHCPRGKEIMSLALAMNDLIGFDRNSLKDPQKHLPRGRVISKGECLKQIPGLDARGLTGGAVWYDCQMHSSERMIFSVLRSAANAGAETANYVKATGFLRKGNRVAGIKAEDVLSGDRFDIRAALVVNASGPWVENVLRLLTGSNTGTKLHLSKAMNVLIGRQLIPKYAVGVFNKAVFNRQGMARKRSQVLFITPWHDYSLIGTTHEAYSGEPDNFRLEEEDIKRFVDEINDAFPAASLGRADIAVFHAGLLPVNGNNNDARGVNLLRRYRIFDHGVEGLVSVVGVKYTTARDVAQKVVDLVFTKLGKRPPKSVTAETPVHGGNIEMFDEFLKAEIQKQSSRMRPDITRHLVYSYGSAYHEVLEYSKKDPRAAERVSDQSPVIRAEVLRGIHEEMAQKLVDIIMRRTELGSFGYPGDSCLRTCAGIMAAKMGWNNSRTNRELAEARAVFSSMNGEKLSPSLFALDQREDVSSISRQ